MVLWSDLDGRHGPGPVRGPAWAPLFASARGRTLVAGPHDAALVRRAGSGDLAVLVRGLPDAERLAASLDAAVYCGGIAKLPAEERFDTVLALDGLERLASAEGDEPDWGERLAGLAAVLRPGGTLVLGVANLCGVHRLTAAPRPLTDSDWTPAAAHDRTRPAGLAGVPEALAAAGLDVVRTYAAFLDPVAPDVLFDVAVLGDDTIRGYVEATLSRGTVPAAGTLSDPVALAVDAAAHGLAPALAPGWVVVARHRPARDAGTLPDVLTATGAAWRRDLPPGRTLSSLVAGAAARRDLPGLRAILTRWQAGPHAGVPAGQMIIGPGGERTALVPAGDPDAALHDLAVSLLRGGAHPWPAVTGPADLAATLGAMTGRDVDPRHLPAAAAPASVAGLIADRDRLSRELAAARAQLTWYEESLDAAESDLARARRTVELLSARGAARAGRRLAGGVRAAVRGGRWLLPRR
ncbi:hypothetical protein GCM10010166_14930 [Couchioplanes caeruleus subsp. azureus]|nr:hypothetical protein GCM10010166_14930 [Couchioplanes caeruleus subsp. azureus]